MITAVDRELHYIQLHSLQVDRLDRMHKYWNNYFPLSLRERNMNGKLENIAFTDTNLSVFQKINAIAQQLNIYIQRDRYKDDVHIKNMLLDAEKSRLDLEEFYVKTALALFVGLAVRQVFQSMVCQVILKTVDNKLAVRKSLAEIKKIDINLKKAPAFLRQSLISTLYS